MERINSLRNLGRAQDTQTYPKSVIEGFYPLVWCSQKEVKPISANLFGWERNALLGFCVALAGCVRLCASVENLNYSDHMRTLVWAFGEASVRGFILLHPAVPSFTPSITGFWSWFFSFYLFPGKRFHLGCYRPEVACQPLGHLWLAQYIMAGCWQIMADWKIKMELPGAAELSTKMTKGVFSSMVALAGALLSYVLGLFCPRQPRSATVEEYSTLGKLLLSLKDIMVQ